MRPIPTASDLIDDVDLRHGRLLLLFQVNPADPDDPPRLLLQDIDEPEAVEGLDSGGCVWFSPSDVPEVIRWLEAALQRFRECAKIDSEKSPPRYWGDLDRHGETPGGVQKSES